MTTGTTTSSGPTTPVWADYRKDDVLKRPDRLPPLTLEWFKAAIQPRFAPDGVVTRVLTPPRRKGTPGERVVAVIGAVIAVCLLLAWAAWGFSH